MVAITTYKQVCSFLFAEHCKYVVHALLQLVA